MIRQMRGNREFWQALEALYEEHDGAREGHDAAAPRSLSRRHFMNLLGASMALAGVGCQTQRAPDEAVPYVRQPEQMVPGVPRHFATSMVLDGYATGLVVQSHDGRPTKIEGNPLHPASMGASGVLEQASILQLYDPQRMQVPFRGAIPTTQESWVQHLRDMRARLGNGQGLHFLVEPTSSPSLLNQLNQLLQTYPQAQIHFYAPLQNWRGEQAASQIFGQPLLPRYDLSQAQTVAAVGSDCLASGPFHLRYAYDFARRRRDDIRDMNRLYVAETTYSPTGSMADHRLPLPPHQLQILLLSVLAQVGTNNGLTQRIPNNAQQLLRAERFAHLVQWGQMLARDLQRNPGQTAVMVGEAQPVVVHALAYAINSALGNIGQSLSFSEPVVPLNTEQAGIAALAEAMGAGDVQTLIVLGGNPVYTAPPALNLGERIPQLRESFYLGPYLNETATACHWKVPQAHYLEMWGDARAYDGTVSFLQPLIRPLFGGRTPSEIVALLLGEDFPQPRAMVQAYWQEREMADEMAFRRAVQEGLLTGTALSTQAPELNEGALAALMAEWPWQAQQEGIELSLEPDPNVYDGRFTNNPWLLELPRPMSKLTWDNAAMVSPTTARELQLTTGDVVQLSDGARSVLAPIWVQPGQADRALTLTLGYGRQGAEQAAQGVGVNAYPMLPAAGVFTSLVQVVKTGRRHELVQTQRETEQHGRPIAIHASLNDFLADPKALKTHVKPEPTLRAARLEGSPQWGMSIDLSVCTGCNACAMACQAENNVPVVGKANVRKRREMHWLRVDRYFVGADQNPTAVMQPMLCQHCERAPCEYVCPVNATVHSPDGLNEMVYNRCVGTRFCSNNCPYKIRRFNWFNFHRGISPLRQMVMNPDVTVRDRGVMEKCTFCVQRIREKQRSARLEGRPLADGDVLTACQQACPTRAIVFGNVADPNSEVAKLHQDPRAYKVLNELSTEPRVRYLIRLRNLNEDMVPT